MNAHYKLKIAGMLLVVVTLAGCAGGKTAFKNANRAETLRDYETAMAEYKKALDAEPENTEYRLKFEQNRFAAAYAHFQKGKLAMEQGNLESARTEFARAKEIDPSHDFAAQELARRQLAQEHERDQTQEHIRHPRPRKRQPCTSRGCRLR